MLKLLLAKRGMTITYSTPYTNLGRPLFYGAENEFLPTVEMLLEAKGVHADLADRYRKLDHGFVAGSSLTENAQGVGFCRWVPIARSLL